MSHSTAKESYDLIITLIETGDLPQAQKAFDEMTALGDHKDVAILRVKAFAIIYAYGEYASYPENAQKTFDDKVATPEDNEDDAIERAGASVAILSAYRDYGSDKHEEDVEKAFADMAAQVSIIGISCMPVALFLYYLPMAIMLVTRKTRKRYLMPCQIRVTMKRLLNVVQKPKKCLMT